MRKEAVCFLLKGEEVLLSPKKLKFAGLWNGYGGTIESGESDVACVVREIWEEARIHVSREDLHRVARIREYIDGILHLELEVFVTRRWKGNPRETNEHGKPKQFPFSRMALDCFDRMFPGDEIWLPQVLMGRRFDAELYISALGRVDRVVFREPTF